jgi:hypothetical protein
LKYYGTLLLDQRLGDEYVDNFHQLSKIYSLTTQHSIEQIELSALKDLLIDFVQGYEALLSWRTESPPSLLSQYSLLTPPCSSHSGLRTSNVLVAVPDGALLWNHQANGSIKVSTEWRMG